jgi:hypothetical protein
MSAQYTKTSYNRHRQLNVLLELYVHTCGTLHVDTLFNYTLVGTHYALVMSTFAHVWMDSLQACWKLYAVGRTVICDA